MSLVARGGVGGVASSVGLQRLSGWGSEVAHRVALSGGGSVWFDGLGGGSWGGAWWGSVSAGL